MNFYGDKAIAGAQNSLQGLFSAFTGGAAPGGEAKKPAQGGTTTAQSTSTKPTETTGQSASFLAQAALPNFGAGAGAPQSNVGGKTLLGS